jgi:polyferredoxin
MLWVILSAMVLAALLAGSGLYFLARWIYFRRHPNPPAESEGARVTTAGLAFSLALVFVFMAALSPQWLWPESVLGRLSGSTPGVLIVASLLGGVATIGARALERRGVILFDRRKRHAE